MILIFLFCSVPFCSAISAFKINIYVASLLFRYDRQSQYLYAFQACCSSISMHSSFLYPDIRKPKPKLDKGGDSSQLRLQKARFLSRLHRSYDVCNYTNYTVAQPVFRRSFVGRVDISRLIVIRLCVELAQMNLSL